MKRLILSLVAVELIAASVPAQVTTGGIEGRILDAEGKPILDVEVVVSSPSLQGTRGVTTGPEGRFRVIELPVGMYRVEFSHVAHRKAVLEEVPVRLGQSTGLGETKVTARVHELPEVTAWGTELLIDPSSTEVGSGFSSTDYTLLPSQRDYRSLVIVAPHVNESFLGDSENIGGSTGSENKYFIDGVESTDPHKGLTGMTLPANFVEEVRVRSSGYEAEYRSSMGGILDVLTFSGGNEFHGQLFGFLTNNRLSADPKRVSWEPESGNYTSWDVGLSIGGPVIRDKLWYYAAYNPSVESEDVLIPGQGYFEDKSTTHRFAGKLSWKASERNNLVLMVVGDPTECRYVQSVLDDHVASPDPCLFDMKTGGQIVSLKGTHRVSNALLINTVLSRHYDLLFREPSTELGKQETLFIDELNDVRSGGGGVFLDNPGTRTTVGVSATLLVGSHTVKSGLEYVENKLRFDETWVTVEYDGRDPYFMGEWIGSGTVANRLPAAFLQDSWRISDRLSVNAGLRWEGQFMVATDGNVAQTITDQWQPRLGFVCLPGTIGSQKLFGSYGRFYQDLSTSTVGVYYVDVIDHWLWYDHDPRVDPSGWYYEWPFSFGIQHEIDGMEGQYYDAFALGYEREVFSGARLCVQGIYRRMGQALDSGYYTDPWPPRRELNNPGKGAMSGFPEAKHEYSALELSVRKSNIDRFGFLISYVLSRTHGNYAGLYDQDRGNSYPNYAHMFNLLEIMENAEGRLPNDRPHVVKCSGFYRFGHGMSAGGSFSWMSGTPRSEWGGTEFGAGQVKYIGGRGEAGRTPSIWDLSLRFTYELLALSRRQWKPRLILDLYHIGSPRKPVDYDEVHYTGDLDDEGNQTDPNPTYGEPIRFQPPMAVRVGMEVDF
jgi:hypothetical protein